MTGNAAFHPHFDTQADSKRSMMRATAEQSLLDIGCVTLLPLEIEVGRSQGAGNGAVRDASWKGTSKWSMCWEETSNCRHLTRQLVFYSLKKEFPLGRCFSDSLLVAHIFEISRGQWFRMSSCWLHSRISFSPICFFLSISVGLVNMQPWFSSGLYSCQSSLVDRHPHYREQSVSQCISLYGSSLSFFP